MRKRRDSKIIVFLEVIALILFGLVVCYTLYKQEATIKIIDINECQIINYKDLRVEIEDLKQYGEGIVIQGFVYMEQKNAQYFDSAVVLKNLKTNEYFEISTAYQERKDVTAAYGYERYDYDHTGFFAKVDTKQLPRDGKFEVYIRYNIHDEDILYKTDKKLTIKNYVLI